MKKLLELVNVVNKHKVKQIEVLGNSMPQRTKVDEFYDKLIDGSISSDEDAALFFYSSTPKDRRYKELKRRLIDRLHNTVLFIDVQQAKYDDIAKAYYICWKDYASAKVLAGRTAISNAYPLMEKILKQAIRFEFSELILDISRQLRLHYSTRNFDPKNFNYYNELYYTYKDRYEADAFAEELYGSTLIAFYNAKGNKLDEVYEKARDYVTQLEPLVEKYDSYKLNLCFYLIQLTATSSINNSDLAIGICERAIEFFQTQSKFPVKALGIFSRHLFLLYWEKQYYEKCETLFKQSLEHSIEGSMGWFTSYDLFFLLCMHSKRYQKAYETLNFVITHKRFKTLSDYSLEKWTVYQAFIAYLSEIGKIEIPNRGKFKVAKFMNEVPNYSSSKRSRNIPILVIQVLFLFLHKRYSDAIDRIDALNLYCSRYLKNDSGYRSNCFIKMLLKIIQADFHRVAAIRKASGLRKKLDSVPLRVAKQVYETEIIPYEDLWELALESLDNKHWEG